MTPKKLFLCLLVISLFPFFPGGPAEVFPHDGDRRYGHIHIRGRLTQPDGSPVAGARVLWRETPRNPYEGRTLESTVGGSITIPEKRPGGSPVAGLNKNCLYRPPAPGSVRTMADGSYELIFLIKNNDECLRALGTLRREEVNVYLEKEGYAISPARGIRTTEPAAPVPER